MDNGFAPREAWPELMTKAQAGDRHAYTQLLRAIVPAIRTLVRRQISDPVLVEDVIQDVLLTVHRVRHTYDPGCPFLPWLMAITQARTVDALRHRGRTLRRETDTEAALVDVAATESAEHQDVQEELTLILDRLPARQREIVEHIHLQEMTLAQAASRHNLTIPAVKSLLHRAITSLRRMGANHDRS
ncbi:sigma-70 family RNA polymerase sigma factor [Lelliottia sp. V89_10]|uniref:sigma-70 family RNA polymerase sigma factor n=1 Tax=Lelliottia wanjuensis TaxID=3050585 RepID=UPI00249DA3FA|nr:MULTISPECIES: sigma-70 family RNA polymerase sigma factor [unclassified Lelliottia]MDI3361861.1 sigma-70 family RNA polymerase sigma factor [Lelliottia sp. V89_13]MDK9550680.1 sigma-70 family RNA polymerase sigma factor [Lelliottia sp. V89_5]MDK9594584.1 sigma-70 family RNA polymerase sigma factor [Lelliottia sp. V89_10]